MMNLRMMSAGQAGILKGAVGTTLVFATGIAVGLFFLKRKHEEELDNLEKDTAMTCLDFAADHYEGVIRRQKKAVGKASSAPMQPVSITPYYEEFLEFQRRLDQAGRHETTEVDQTALQQESERRIKKFEELKLKVVEQNARMDLEFDRIKLDILAKRAAELAAKACAAREIETPNKEPGDCLQVVENADKKGGLEE